MPPDAFVLKGPSSSPHLVVFGAVHGDEACGPIAIEEIRRDPPRLLRGKATFVPVCNLSAYAAGKRFIDQNMNRIFFPHTAPVNGEQRRVNELIPLVDSADFLLDVHSMPASGRPFAFCDSSDDARTVAWARRLGFGHVVFDWPKVFPGEAGGTTAEYAASRGVAALTIECAEHRDPAATATALRAIMRSLMHLEMIEKENGFGDVPFTGVRMKQRVLYDGKGQFVRPWEHLDRVKRGDPIADNYAAPYDAFIVLPKTTTRPLPGQEWFYLGVDF